MKRVFLYVSLLMTIFFVACTEKGGDVGPSVSGEVEIEIVLEEDVWTYFSMETCEVVGTSDFNDSTEDTQWAERPDWDVAFCNGFIRTNGGTSGHGDGAILLSNVDYDALDEVPDAPLVKDAIIGGSNK